MSERNRTTIWKTLVPFGVLALALAVLRRRPDDWEYEQDEPERPAAPEPAARVVARRSPAARFATTAAFTALFFAGAAFTAGAGDQAAQLLEGDTAVVENLALEAETVVAETQAAVTEPAPQPEPAPEPAPAPIEASPVEAAPAEAAPVEAAPVEAAPIEAAPAEAAPADATPVEAPAPDVAPEAYDPDVAVPVVAPAADDAPAPRNVTASSSPAVQPAVAAPAPKPVVRPRTKKWVVRRAATPPIAEPEIEHANHSGDATVWLNRALPDPTPASARLQRSFVKALVAAAQRHGADWAAVLGVLRAQGERGSAPASPRELDTLARRLAGRDAWKGALAVSGRTAFADRADALADLYRSVGVEALVTGFAAAKERLVERLLEREGVLVYSGGRADLEAGRVDVRIVVLLGYLAERHESVTVSSLFSGHRTFARPGVVSAHVYGHAVDVAAVGGTPIAGHSTPGGVTEEAVRSILLLPSELQPRQVISLLGLGGPSFPLRDHGDHIHVGY